MQQKKGKDSNKISFSFFSFLIATVAILWWKLEGERTQSTEQIFGNRAGVWKPSLNCEDTKAKTIPKKKGTEDMFGID